MVDPDAFAVLTRQLAGILSGALTAAGASDAAVLHAPAPRPPDGGAVVLWLSAVRPDPNRRYGRGLATRERRDDQLDRVGFRLVYGMAATHADPLRQQQLLAIAIAALLGCARLPVEPVQLDGSGHPQPSLRQLSLLDVEPEALQAMWPAATPPPGPLTAWELLPVLVEPGVGPGS